MRTEQIHAGDIAGVVVTAPAVHIDKVDDGEVSLKPGLLFEHWRHDRSGMPSEIKQITITLAHKGAVKNFHCHGIQWDIWCVQTGTAKVVLRDMRPDSPTYLATMEIYCGLRNWKLIAIPPGVAHGYKVLSNEPCMLAYATTETYNPSDEGRYDPDDPRMAYDWNAVGVDADPAETIIAREA